MFSSHTVRPDRFIAKVVINYPFSTDCKNALDENYTSVILFCLYLIIVMSVSFYFGLNRLHNMYIFDSKTTDIVQLKKTVYSLYGATNNINMNV